MEHTFTLLPPLRHVCLCVEQKSEQEIRDFPKFDQKEE